jgi:hypothetical protein
MNSHGFQPVVKKNRIHGFGGIFAVLAKIMTKPAELWIMSTPKKTASIFIIKRIEKHEAGKCTPH